MRRLRSASTRAGREEAGQLLLEGTHLLEELLKAFVLPDQVIATGIWIDRHPELVAKLSGSVQWFHVTEEVLRAALTTVTPDGVACLCPLDVLPSPPDHCNFRIVLDRIQDPGNMGSLLRTALAADVQCAWLGSGVDPLGSKTLRSSAGAVLRLPHQRFGPSESEAIDQLEQALLGLVMEGVQVVATMAPDASGPLHPFPYWELDWNHPTALVLGNEGAGLHPRLQACCTHAITVPHSERVESLNVAAAAVPLLLERRRATMSATTTQQSG